MPETFEELLNRRMTELNLNAPRLAYQLGIITGKPEDVKKIRRWMTGQHPEAKMIGPLARALGEPYDVIVAALEYDGRDDTEAGRAQRAEGGRERALGDQSSEIAGEDA